MYKFLSCYQNAGQKQNMKIENRSFENMLQFKYLGTSVTNQYLIQNEIKGRLSSDNVCYHSVQNFYLLVCCQKTKIKCTRL
jgi:hypothetical protein